MLIHIKKAAEKRNAHKRHNKNAVYQVTRAYAPSLNALLL